MLLRQRSFKRKVSTPEVTRFFCSRQTLLRAGSRQKRSATRGSQGAGTQLANFRFPSTKKEFRHLAQALRPADTIAVEVSTSANAVGSLWPFNSSAKVLLANPLQTKMMASAKVKTDQLDARVLAELARVDYLPTVWTPAADTLRRRHFCTEREALVRHRTEFKNQVPAILHRNLVQYEFSDLFGVEGRAWLSKLLAGTALDADEIERVQFYLNKSKQRDTHGNDLAQTIAALRYSRPVWRAQMR